MNTSKLLLATAAIALVTAGCSRSGTVPTTGSSGDVEFGSGSNGSDAGLVTTRGGDIGGSGLISYPGMPAGDGELLQNLVVYFDFDSSQIRADFNELLAAHGRYLAQDRNLMVRLDGHADERGSREYNIGLGERRAQGVRQILMLQGASASQISTVSYGEERPAVFGSDDEAYSLNRRVEIVYP